MPTSDSYHAALKNTKVVKKKKLLFTNIVPGDETTDLVKVKALTPDQKLIKTEADKLRIEIKQTRKELEQKEKRLEFINSHCSHHIFSDWQPFTWSEYWRTCELCGEHMGVIK